MYGLRVSEDGVMGGGGVSVAGIGVGGDGGWLEGGPGVRMCCEYGCVCAFAGGMFPGAENLVCMRFAGMRWLVIYFML